MSPGCFTIEQQQQQQSLNDLNNCEMLILNETSYDLDNLTTNTNTKCEHVFSSASEILKNSNYKHSFIFTSYHHEINLDTIPLPSTPYPFKEEEEEEENSSQTQSTSSLCDTIDSFEILEQTIMKQKRLGRCKNVDLRKKVLLKRTFDLVCEIMDHENGFEEEDTAEETTSKSNENLLVVNTPKESLDIEEVNTSETSTLPNLVNLVYLDNNKTSTNINSIQQNDQILRTILNSDETTNSNFSNTYSNFSTSSSSSSLAQLTNISSLKRKHTMSFVSSSSCSSNKKAKLQRRPSNSDDDDFEDDEYDENDENIELQQQHNFICLFDDDNDPFGIANLTSF